MVNELVRGKASEPPVLRWQDDVEAAQWGRELATCLQPTQHRSSRDQGATQRRHRFRCREVMATFADEVIQEWAARGQCSGVERVTIGGESANSGRWTRIIAKSNEKRYFVQSQARGQGRAVTPLVVAILARFRLADLSAAASGSNPRTLPRTCHSPPHCAVASRARRGSPRTPARHPESASPRAGTRPAASRADRWLALRP